MKSDVLIVGAGPAGACAATLLARAGIDVCVVDGATFPRDKTCGDALSNRAVTLADEIIGAPGALRALPHAIVERAAAIFPDGSRIERAFGGQVGLIVPRYELDQALCSAVPQAGARLVQGQRVRELRPTRHGYEAHGPKDFRWEARVVIAADGPGSVGWAALGQPYPRGRHLALAVTTYVEGARDGQTCNEHYFDAQLPCGYGWVFPAVDGRANVGVYQRADWFDTAHTPGSRSTRAFGALLERFLTRLASRLGPHARPGPLRTWALPLCTSITPPAAPRLLCIGDAGCLVDPLAGEGIWQALRSAELAAWIVSDALRARGDVDARAAYTYQARCAKEIGLPSLARLAVQESLRQIVGRRWYRHALVRHALHWGYGREALEVSKQLS